MITRTSIETNKIDKITRVANIFNDFSTGKNKKFETTSNVIQRTIANT